MATRTLESRFERMSVNDENEQPGYSKAKVRLLNWRCARTRNSHRAGFYSSWFAHPGIITACIESEPSQPSQARRAE